MPERADIVVKVEPHPDIKGAWRLIAEGEPPGTTPLAVFYGDTAEEWAIEFTVGKFMRFRIMPSVCRLSD